MYVHNLNPVLFDFLGLQVRFYGVFLALLFIIGFFLGKWYLKIHDKDPKKVDDLFIVSFISFLIGARLGHIIFYNLSYFLKHPLEIFFIWRGGLASHGAVIGLILGMLYLMKKTNLKFFFISDLFSWVGSLAVFFVRLGNFFNGEIVGRTTDSPLGVIFSCEKYKLNQCSEVPRHPVQLYESVLGICIFIVLSLLVKKYKKKLPFGIITSIFLILYFGGRFLLEFFKEYTGQLILFPLTNGQVLSIPLVLIGILLLYKIGKNKSIFSK
ncbi:MAG: Prolipoprotein diacylglyceryl transferase [Candidatus Peregrinibacteria bacterium GW2011_GWA2_33_10]|nr:MAG: Prolipoprotein diacylglyceryl transferase [Candidatus Peregrinibacteria bacterium GW2011_GWA2_33_10]KKP40978.1 MAG: prolipoprotein diacylglyceryl transferase [Candidatus Peregrinibacteria bacterium GW2011_GWC2_33_13]